MTVGNWHQFFLETCCHPRLLPSHHSHGLIGILILLLLFLLLSSLLPLQLLMFHSKLGCIPLSPKKPLGSHELSGKKDGTWWCWHTEGRICHGRSFSNHTWWQRHSESKAATYLKLQLQYQLSAMISIGKVWLRGGWMAMTAYCKIKCSKPPFNSL